MNIGCEFIHGTNYAITTREHKINGDVIPMLFKWNGASVPLWIYIIVPFLFLTPFHRTLRRASLWHDYAYWMGKPRLESDMMMIQMCKEDGMNSAQLFAVWLALFVAGWKTYNDIQKARRG